ncbi:FGGY-family carbohydrate kinase [Alphaproteobacteria bacterium KMM 3653]|uniref:FGGY-family carbohydrate kinase n=1 Tax=Harenicola maris TaxID=2841044 RepID=A0AAP2GA29_9RHOB|nr:FGGY-family carbohydrate kinase [Harenicola maris]
MSAARHIAVIDIGKTNAKLALVDLRSLNEIAVRTRPNVVISAPPWPHFDVDGHWQFLLSALSEFHRDHGIDAISITTHGACAALLTAEGQLAAPILDYEHEYAPDVVAEYAALKPDFADTGSPKLVGGLNLGAQIHWQFGVDTALKTRTAKIVTYPQYWGHRLTGVAATDVTSLGCHTDLWNPHRQSFSDLPAKLGILDKIAPVRRPGDILGPILPEIAQATGLDPQTPVCVGIHDSNASLYPHVIAQDGPASVVSTGTWVIAMALGADGTQIIPPLDPDRDTLINVNALGRAVASARFMGGREYEMIQQGQGDALSRQDVNSVLQTSLMLLPSVASGSGPFQDREMEWRGPEPPLGSGHRSAALSFYLALVTSTCLKLVGADGPTIVEGPFAKNDAFVAMLQAATNRPVRISEASTGTSIGAALLFSKTPAQARVSEPKALYPNLELAAYAELWNEALEGP